jgi:biopolymer transport protein ExbD
MPVNLPKAASGRQAPAESAAITIDKDDRLFLETTGRHVTLTSPWSATALPASTHASIATLITSWRRRTGFTLSSHG